MEVKAVIRVARGIIRSVVNHHHMDVPIHCGLEAGIVQAERTD